MYKDYKMGLFSIFASKDKKIVKSYRDLENKFMVGIKIDNLSDDDILYIHNNAQENFNFSDFSKDFSVQPIRQELLFATTCELLEIYNSNNKSKDIYQQILGQFLEEYLNKGEAGLYSIFRPAAQTRYVMLFKQ